MIEHVLKKKPLTEFLLGYRAAFTIKKYIRKYHTYSSKTYAKNFP